MRATCKAAVVAGLSAVWAMSAFAQDYPSRQVNLVIPFPPGGNTDLMARALQPELAKALGQPVVAINKGGAGGTIGNIEVSSARPDGYTVGLTPNNPLTAQPHVQKLPYGMDSFKYVCLTYYVPYVLIASPKAPFKTFQEFAAFAKAKSDNLIYASPGPGTQPHLGILSALGAIKAEGVHVPFTGAGPMSQAMLAGTVMAMSEVDGGGEGQQPRGAGSANQGADRRPAGCADHAGAGLPVRSLQCRRPGRSRGHAGCGCRATAEGLRRCRRQRWLQAGNGKAQRGTRAICRARSSARCSMRTRCAMRTR